MELRGLGRDEGRITGPRPGDGASSIGGCPDADGTPGDVLPPRLDQEGAPTALLTEEENDAHTSGAEQLAASR